MMRVHPEQHTSEAPFALPSIDTFISDIELGRLGFNASSATQSYSPRSRQIVPHTTSLLSTDAMSMYDDSDQDDWTRITTRSASPVTISDSSSVSGHTSTTATARRSSAKRSQSPDPPIDEESFRKRVAKHNPDPHTVSEQRRRNEANLLNLMMQRIIEEVLGKRCRKRDAADLWVGNKVCNDKRTTARNSVSTSVCVQLMKDRKFRAFTKKMFNDPVVLEVLKSRGHLERYIHLNSIHFLDEVIAETRACFDSLNMSQEEYEQEAKDKFATNLRKTMVAEQRELVNKRSGESTLTERPRKRAQSKQQQRRLRSGSIASLSYIAPLGYKGQEDQAIYSSC